ncbi:MAG: SPOR domain-containing protein [Candidatus Omnitrophica bacterium]|nr:SPOR domain-containing protein [Candidatus Omnitrophota bacterium]
MSEQLELFKDQGMGGSGKDDKHKIPFNFFNIAKRNEKVILIVIVLIVIFGISFSLGIEKGKRSTKSRPIKKEQVLKKKISRLNKERGYTIQVATFKNRMRAEKEAKRLKDRGRRSFVEKVGIYFRVCVGNFLDKKEAKAALDELRKTYQDCLIRRL